MSHDPNVSSGPEKTQTNRVVSKGVKIKNQKQSESSSSVEKEEIKNLSNPYGEYLKTISKKCHESYDHAFQMAKPPLEKGYRLCEKRFFSFIALPWVQKSITKFLHVTKPLHPYILKALSFSKKFLLKKKHEFQENFLGKDLSDIKIDFANLETSNVHIKHIRKRLPGLSRPISLEEGSPPRGSTLTIHVICGILGAFILWAMITPITEVAVSSGQIIPSSLVKIIQHLEGGIVKELYVQDGVEIKEGDLLLKLDEKAVNAEFEQTEAHEVALQIKAERLRSFGGKEAPDFSKFPKEYQNLVRDQQSIYSMQMQNREDQRAIILKQIEQRKATLSLQEERQKDLQHRVDGLKKQRDVLKGLYDKKLKTGTELRASEDTLAEVEVDLNQAKNSMQETKQAIAENESRLLELDTRLRNEALTEMGNVTSELAQVMDQKSKLADRLKRLEIRAPASGIIKGLKNTTIQGVVQPGAEILQVVPKEDLEVEARVLPKDAGRVREGQNVLVKVTAYDYPRYGGIKGTVKSVSATTFMDEKNNPYYRVLITLEKNYVGANPNKNVLAPGMTVQADIEVDDKTLFQYLIKPIYMALHDSFREH